MDLPGQLPSLLVVLSGHGKMDWFPRIRAGELPDTPYHAIGRLASQSLRVTYVDEVPTLPKLGIGFLDKLLARLGALSRSFSMLRYDSVLTSDVSYAACLASLVRRVVGRGPRWFMVAVSASVMARRLQAEGKTFRLSLLRRCWRSCAGIVCLAGSQSETFTVAGVLPQKIVTIPLGIDVNSLGSIGLRGKGDDPGDYVLSIGKDLGRDYPFLLQVAAMVPYPLRVVTSEQSLPRTAALPQNVSVEYDLSYAEVGERLAQCRFVVVPLVSDSTVGSDCTGQTVVLQALAAGRAVCVSHMPWLSDYLGAGEYALLPSRDPAAAAQTLVEIWENPTRCSQLAAAGQRAAREKFSLEAFEIGRAHV